MSVLNSDIVVYGSANMPEADALTTGGAVTFTTRVSFADLSANGTVNYVSSSSSDTAVTIACTGRDTTGALQTETKTLTGTTVVTGSQTFERLMKAVAGGTTAVGDIACYAATALVTGTAQGGGAASGVLGAYITLQSGQGASVSLGSVIHTTGGTGPNQLRYIVAINPTGSNADQVTVNKAWSTVPDATTTYTVNRGFVLELGPNQVTTVRRPFYGIAADTPGGSTRNFYEKVFIVNNNTTTALTVASVIKQADPSVGTLEFALCNSLNDSGTVTNRQTLPSSGITAFSTGAAPQTVAVPTPQNLPSGAAPNSAGAQGIWLNWSIPAGTSPTKTTTTIRGTGQTT